MNSFEEHFDERVLKGEALNPMFDLKVFALATVLNEITDALDEEGIAYEVIGGMAVLIHVEEVDPMLTPLARDIDLLVRRDDLERITDVAARHGFRYDDSDGSVRLFSDRHSRLAVDLMFTGETVRPDRTIRNPDEIVPVKMRLYRKDVNVIRVADLVEMKLHSERSVDRVHLRSLDDVGLITGDVEERLTDELRERLQHIRETE